MAGEIFIADKQTLDSVKQDTEYIKNQFPVSGGTAWEDYNYMCENKKWDKVPAFREWVDILNISGEGYIKYLTAETGSVLNPGEVTSMKLRLVKDGEIICDLITDGMYCSILLTSLSGGVFTCTNDKNRFSRAIDTIFFKKSLKLQMYYDNKYKGLDSKEGFLKFIGGVK